MTCPFAHINEVKVGTKLRADGGFTCIPEGVILEVQADAEGSLWVPCNGAEDFPEPGDVIPAACDSHHLCGQLGMHEDDQDHYVGFYLSA